MVNNIITWQSGYGSSVATFETRNFGTISIAIGAFEHNPGLGSIHFDPSDSNNSNGYHEYHSTFETGISTNEASMGTVVRYLQEYPTPFTQGFAGPGFVFAAQPDGYASIVNATEAGWHVLNPGVVQRRIIVENGEYVIETVGIGVGLLGQMNTWPILTEPVWDFTGLKLSIGEEVASDSLEFAYWLKMQVPGFSRAHCFPAHTLIQISLTTTTPIAALLPGDIVLAFDPAADLGRGALVPRRITRLYRNTTTEWIKLNWLENGQPKELITTPGHHFLNDLGQFPTIAAMLRDGQTTVVLADGSLTEVTATRISYAADTAHLFDRALSFAATGNAAAQAVELDCWQTYNFEVEDLHTYVVGGVSKTGNYWRDGRGLVV